MLRSASAPVGHLARKQSHHSLLGGAFGTRDTAPRSKSAKRKVGIVRCVVMWELAQAQLFDHRQLEDSRRQPLNDPVWTDAHDHLRDDDPVLGLYLDGQAWALPWWIIKEPHVANLSLDAGPVLVTLCVMCSTAAAFRAEVEGERLVFRLRGRYNGTMLLEDRATQSFWSPFTGVALTGPMRETALKRLPLSQCLWREWLAMYPTTRVLSAEHASREVRGSHFSPGSPGIYPGFLATLVRPLDARLPHNMLVLGVEHAAKARAYPLSALAQIGPVLNDTLGGVEIVLRCRPGTLQALAFHRRVGDRLLVFGYAKARGVYDEETNSVWNEMGEAIAGPLAGTQLAYLESGVGEWYEFAAYHPGAEIFEATQGAERIGRKAIVRYRIR
jgi:hypothetical protein